MKVVLFLALVVGLSLARSPLAAQTLRYSAVSSWNMPYGRFDGEQLVEGIMYDLAMAIEKQVQIPVTFVVLPRKRVDGAALSDEDD